MLRVTILLVALHGALQATPQLNKCSGGDICVPIVQCPIFGSDPPITWTPAVQDEFEKRVCEQETNSVNRTIYKVCCEPSASGETSDGRKRGLALLDLKGCGMNRMHSNETLENNGTLGQLPWTALLKTSSGEFACAASLISERYVLTVAHCIKNRNVTFVQLRKKDCDEQGVCTLAPQDIPVERAIAHDGFSARRKLNDIALVRLAQNVSFNNDVLPICLPVAPEYQPAGSNYFTARDGQDYASLNTDTISITEVHPLTTENCENRLQELIKRQHKIQESHICGYEAGSFDGCATSAGGPLVALDRFGRNVQHGVVSYGVQDCSLENVPSVYTRVESFINWILHNLEE